MTGPPPEHPENTGLYGRGPQPTGQPGVYYSGSSYQPGPLAGEPPPPAYEFGQPYPQSAPPYDMPTTGAPYPYPSSAPPAAPAAGQPYPASGPPPGAPPPRKKGRQIVWFASGIIAAMAIATVLVGGIVIGQDDGKKSVPKPSATSKKYNVAQTACAITVWFVRVHELAPVEVKEGEPNTSTLVDNVVEKSCDGEVRTTTNKDGRLTASASFAYYSDAAAAEKEFRRVHLEGKDDCSAEAKVAELGQRACMAAGHRTIAGESGPPGSAHELVVWDGNLVMLVSVYHSGTLTDKMKEVREAAIADSRKMLEELAKED